MGQTTAFDAFYGQTRRRALLHALVLTASPTTARAVVLEAYEAAWARWDSVGEQADPRDWVRGRLLDRTPGGARGVTAPGRGRSGDAAPLPEPDAEQAALLDTLAAMSTGQRRAWAVVELAGRDVEAAAQELSRPAEEVRADVEAARDSLSRPGTGHSSPDRPAGGTGHLMADDPWTTEDVIVTLADLAHRTALPAPPQLRSSGPSTRLTRTTVLGAVAAATGVVLVLGAGIAVVSSATGGGSGQGRPSGAPDVTEVLTPAALVGPAALDPLGRGGWVEAGTTSTPSDTGPSSLCQQATSADPAALAVQNRRFTSGSAAAEETVVVSRSTELGAATYDRTEGWWASCIGTTVLLESSWTVGGLGDDSRVLTLRDWADPSASYVVALARAGATTVSLVSVDPVASAAQPDEQRPGTPEEAAQVLAAALTAACSSDAAACGEAGAPGRLAAEDVQRSAPPAPAGSRGLLVTVDLPPPGIVQEPWSASPPVSTTGEIRPSDSRAAATPCDRITFEQAGASTIYSRSFGVPGDPNLPDYFGLAETAGTFAGPEQASQALADVVSAVDSCPDRIGSATIRDFGRDLGGEGGDPDLEYAWWALAYDDDQGDRVFVRTAVVRNGSNVARLTFVPGPTSDLSAGPFTLVVTRAQARLADMVDTDLPS